MRFLAFITILVLLFLSSFEAYSQNEGPKTSTLQNMTFSFDYNQGKMMKIYSSSPKVSNSRYYGLNILWQTDGSQAWHHSYGLPDVGINLFYTVLGNDSIIGRSYGICPNMVIKIRSQKRWGGLIKLGTGFAYNTKPYNRINNPDNLILGSHVTNMTNFNFGAFVKITKQITLNAGYSIFHFSTGHIKIPNYGFNDFAWNVGLRYKPMKTVFKQAKIDTCPQKQFLVNSRLSLGYQQLSGTVSPNGGPLYPIYSISGYISKKLGTVNNIRLGLQASYFTSYHDYMISEGYFRGKENANSWVVSFIFGDEWQIGKIGFLLEPSIKFYNPFFQRVMVDESNENKKIWNQKRWLSIKSGFAYYLLNKADKPKLNPAIGLYINTNKTQADFVDVTFSCGF